MTNSHGRRAAGRPLKGQHRHQEVLPYSVFCEIATRSHKIVQIAPDLTDCPGLQPKIQPDLVLKWRVTVV